MAALGPGGVECCPGSATPFSPTCRWVGWIQGAALCECVWVCRRQGGDSGTGEYPLMALDYFLWTNDSTTFTSKYLKVPIQAATYFVNHYKVCVWMCGHAPLGFGVDVERP